MLLCYSHQHISLKRLFYHPQEGSVCVEIRVLRMKYSHQHAPSFQKCYKFKIANPVVSDRVIQQRKSSNSQYLLAEEKTDLVFTSPPAPISPLGEATKRLLLSPARKVNVFPHPKPALLLSPQPFQTLPPTTSTDEERAQLEIAPGPWTISSEFPIPREHVEKVSRQVSLPSHPGSFLLLGTHYRFHLQVRRGKNA